MTISTVSKDDGDTVLTLFDEAGTQIAFNDDAYGTLQSAIETCLPTGRYYIQIRGINASVSFSYELDVCGGEPCSNP